MPRYLIERSIPEASKLTAMELKAIAEQSILVQWNLPGQIQWIHSTLTADRMICLYVADNAMTVRAHARCSGLPINRISKVSAIIGPTMNTLD